MNSEYNYKNRQLNWYSQDVADIADKFGTPLHICSKQALLESIEQFCQPFSGQEIPVKCFYSIKTNPVPGLLTLLKEKDIGVEVISEYELWLAQQLGFPGSEIIVNGPAKSDALFRAAFRARVRLLVIESAAEARRLVSVCKEQKGPLAVAVRICPSLSSLSSTFNPTLHSGSKFSPYGFLPDSRDLWTALQMLQNCPQIRFSGFHIHLGSGISSSKPFGRAFSVLGKTILKAFKKGWQCRVIDIGGGFGLPAAPVLKPHQLAAAFFMKGSHKSGRKNKKQLLMEISQMLSKTLTRLKRQGCSIEEVYTEPGRILTGSAQMIVLTVLDVIERKHRTGRSRKFLICDGGGMSLSPMFLTEAHTVLPLRQNGGENLEYTIVGNLPSSLDRVSISARLPQMAKGDRLTVLDTGGYFTSFNNNFAGPRPGIVLFDEKGTRLIRERETFAQVVSRDMCMK
jgi:diaminopimelate decarboxylase